MSMRFEAKKKPEVVRRKVPVGKIVAVAIAVLLLIVGSAWGVRETMASRRRAANLAELRQLGELRKSDAYKGMTAEQKSQLWKDYFAKFNQLTFEQRKKLMNERSKEEQERYNEYFSAPPDQRDAILARQMAERGKLWAGRGGPGGNGNQNAGSSAKGGPSAKGNNPSQANGTPPANGQAMGGEQRRREFLDMTTPEQRAQRSVYRQAMREQMQQMQQGGR